MQKITNMLSKEDLSNRYEYPAYSAESTNNGIIGYTKHPEFICDKEHPIYITFGDHTRTFNIAKKSFSVLDNVKVLLPIINNYRSLLWIITAWQKKIPNLGYARHWKIAKNCIIQLPTKCGQIDFEFMESFVAELEARRVAELEAYLLATGLKDYTLTEEERNALENYNTMSFGKFAVTDVFDIKNTSNILSCDITENSGETPYLCASAENNSVSSYISYNRRYIEEGNCIFIGGKTFVVSWQKEDFFSNDSHNLALYYKGEQKDRLTQLFLATCIKKSLCYKYSWGNSISKSKIKEDYVDLPVKDCELDLQNVKTLISAIQKLVIKDVVLYADSKIAETKNIIQKR